MDTNYRLAVLAASISGGQTPMRELQDVNYRAMMLIGSHEKSLLANNESRFLAAILARKHGIFNTKG